MDLKRDRDQEIEVWDIFLEVIGFLFLKETAQKYFLLFEILVAVSGSITPLEQVTEDAQAH